MKALRWIGIALLAIIAISAIGGWIALTVLSGRNAAQPAAIAAMTPDATVVATGGDWVTFSPSSGTPDTGFIIYPGGLVDPVAYAPIARAIAARGYFVVLDSAPLNLAVIDPGAAAGIIAAYPDIQAWAVGGHSLGGAMAADFVFKNPDAADGLALWAAYPAGNADLSDRDDLEVVSVYGTNDGLATLEDIEASKSRLPADTVFVAIEGGNHTQFGSYGTGLQSGDNPAGISAEQQQAQIIDATVAMLERIRPPQ
jgi:dienelactone hydrolase